MLPFVISGFYPRSEPEFRLAKREREETELADEQTTLKRPTISPTEPPRMTFNDADAIRNVFNKREREDLEEEPASTHARTNRLSCFTIGPSTRVSLLLACSQGNIAHIQEHIQRQPSLLEDLRLGIFSRNNQLNDLLLGLNHAIIHNKTAVVTFLLSYPTIRACAHYQKNLLLRVALFNSSTLITAELLQIPAVIKTIDKKFFEKYLVSTAESGNLFQFLMLLFVQGVELSLHILDCGSHARSLLDVITCCQEKFPKLHKAWQELIETDYTLFCEDGKAIVLEKKQILDLIKLSPWPIGIDVEDLPDLENLRIY